MNDRKINISRAAITAGEIQGYKNFDALVKRYESATRFRYYQFGVMGLAAAAVAVFIVLMVWNPVQPAASTAFIQPPMEEIDIGYSDYNVDAGQGEELSYMTGSIIKIPQNAFLDKDGNLVTGKVDVKYREFHDPVDFFVSGIPMTYDSAGTTYHFESAGMLELTASQAGEPLFVNPENKIEVAMVSMQPGSDYNFYYLDTVKKLWAYKGKDKAAVCEPPTFDSIPFKYSETIGDTASAGNPDYIRQFGVEAEIADQKTSQLSAEVDRAREAVLTVEEAKPMKPRKATLTGRKFNIDVDPKEFPELAYYKGMYFEVGEENKNFDARMYNVTWEDAQLRENIKGVNYRLMLSKGKEQHDLIVYPVYEGEDFETAIKSYEKRFSEYEVSLAARKAEEKRKQEEYEASLKKLKEERLARQKQMEEQRAAQMKAWQEQQAAYAEIQKKMDDELVASASKKGNNILAVTRVFTVSNFGFWNCDRPQMLPNQRVLTVGFADPHGKALRLNYAYLAEKGRNAVFTYTPDYTRFGYNPASDNWLWGVTAENKLAVFMPADFKKIPAGVASYTLVMQVVEREFKTAGEVREFLGLKPSAAVQLML